MNIIEALKSGKRFKRKEWDRFFNTNEDHWSLIKEEILAEDWEVEELSVTVTEKAFWEAVVRAQIPQEQAKALAKELGL